MSPSEDRSDLQGVEVTITDEQSSISIDGDDVISLVDHVLRDAGTVGRVGILFVDDETISGLHLRFLGVDGPTDVITFPMEDSGSPSPTPLAANAIDGEIVISTETALRQAPLYERDPREETLLYVVHGLLHLLGEDDREEAGARRMALRQGRLLDSWIASRGP